MEKNKEYWEYQCNIRLTLAYMLADICEAMLADSEDYRKKAGLPGLRYEQKMYWKGFFKNATALRRSMADTRDDAFSYADTCEVFQDVFLALADRCGENEEENPITKVEEFILSFPSRRNIELSD